MRRKASRDEIEVLRAIAAFQWDWNVAFSLFPEGEEFSVDIRRGRVRYVILEGRVYLTLRPNDGLFSVSIPAAERIVSSTVPPRFRLVVRGDREIRGSILARDIVGIDPGLRPGDEVVIVDKEDSLIGVGRLRVPVNMMEGLVYGEVARVRSRV
ncbi:MAG: tRNA-guanine transglycosylase [Desulfurococcales archaeon]|nr:tRNA-guanine transglycosylase [Desulfurococcales archaeon]